MRRDGRSIFTKLVDPTNVVTEIAALRPNDEYLPHAEMDALTARVNVCARAKPEDKLEIVQSLQRQGLVAGRTRSPSRRLLSRFRRRQFELIPRDLVAPGCPRRAWHGDWWKKRSRTL